MTTASPSLRIDYDTIAEVRRKFGEEAAVFSGPISEIGGIAVSSPGFGQIGSGLNTAFNQSRAALQDQVKADQAQLRDFCARLAKNQEHWAKTEDANTMTPESFGV